MIDLTVGEPDFDTPEFIKQFAIEGLEHGLTKYTPSAGMKSFQEAIADFYAHRFGAAFPASQVARIVRRKQALFNAACTILESRRRTSDPETLLGNVSGDRNILPCKECLY